METEVHYKSKVKDKREVSEETVVVVRPEILFVRKVIKYSLCKIFLPSLDVELFTKRIKIWFPTMISQSFLYIKRMFR